MRQEIERLAGHYGFFHWHLEFPSVFGPAGRGGFDLVLGNPPWDTLSPDRREFFGQYHAGMRSLSPDEQDVVIERLVQDEAVAAAWALNQRDLFGLVHFLKDSGRFTLYAPGNLGKGDFNVYRMFTELALKHTRLGGYAAQVLPGGIYGGANASAIRRFMFDQCELRDLWGLINTRRGWFAHVDIDRFAAYAARRGGRTRTFLAHFGLTEPADLGGRPVEFHADFIRTNAAETYAIPDVRSTADLTAARKMLDAHPAFGDKSAGPPRRHYQAELHMGNDAGRFTTDPVGLPVYEGRMISHFDHRAKTYDSGHGNSSRWTERPFGDPGKAIGPQWRVLPTEVPDKLGNRRERYRLAVGDVANPRNERSFTAALVPPGVICGHTVPTIVFDAAHEWMYLTWLAVANAFVMDWFTRKKLCSPHLTYSVMDSLPFPRPKLDEPWVQRAAPLVLRLICTAPEMTPFWNRMAALGLCLAVPEGIVPPEALVDEAARQLARAELDALVAHEVYGLTRDELADILETFPVVKKRDIAACGDFRTKRVILEIYDAMQEAMRTGEPYQTRLNPPPADPNCCHPPLPLGILAYGSLIQDPGPEIEPHIRLRIDTETDFPVEYARLSTKRGGAPTLVPHPNGAPVKAQILVLDDEVSADEAANRLWRRETGTQDRTQPYPVGTSPNSVQCQRTTYPSVTTVLYTDFLPEGKIEHPTAAELAKAAIASVAKAAPGQDGITYLRNAIAAGTKTPLTDDYKAEILLQTGTESLADALAQVLGSAAPD
jgi:hypothetical protein